MISTPAILEAVDWLHGSLTESTFVERAIGLAKACYPSSVVAYHHVSSRRENHQLHRCEDTRAKPDVQRAWQRHAMNSPVVKYYLAGGTDPVLATQELISDRALRNSALYDECWRPFGTTHQVGLRLWSSDHVAGLSIKRDGFFRDDERRLLLALYPHFLRAWKTAERCEVRVPQVACPMTADDERSRNGDSEMIFQVLTPREREVLHWISEGKRNAEIAVVLGNSVATVKTHVENILEKLGVETRGSAAAMWLRRAAAERA